MSVFARAPEVVTFEDMASLDRGRFTGVLDKAITFWECLKSKQKVLRAKVFRHFIEKAHHYLEVSRDKPFSLSSLSKRSFWQKVGSKILYT